MIHRRNLRSLDEELEGLGCEIGSAGLAAIADRRLDESAHNGQAFGVIGALGSASPSDNAPWLDGHSDLIDTDGEDLDDDDEYLMAEDDDDDPIDGAWVTHELLHRIENLEIDESWGDEGDTRFEQLLDGLAEKSVPADDAELQARAEALVVFLSEGRFNKIKGTFGGQFKRAERGFRKGPTGAYTKIPVGERKKAARILKKKRRGAKGVKDKKYARVRGARMSRIRKMRGLQSPSAREDFDMSSASGGQLAEELRDLLDHETTPQTMFEDTLERMERVLALIALHVEDEAVTDVLSEAWENATEQLHEDTDEDELMESLKPVISLMAHCLKQIDYEEPEGN